MAEYNQDWEDLGRNIQDIIDRAVNSQDYQRLNQTITQIVNKAVDTGNEAIRRAKEQNYNRKKGKVVYTYTPGKEEPVHRKAAPQQASPQRNLPVLYGNVTGKTAGGILKTIGGSMLTGASALGLIGSAAIKALITGGSLLTGSMAVLGAGLVGGAVLLGSGICSLSKLSRFKMYLKVLGQKTYCGLDQLARSVGKNTRFVKKDLTKMIGEGLFLEGHLDAEGKSLITSHETYRHYQQSQRQLEEQKRKARAEEQLRSQPRPVTPQVQEVLDKGQAFLSQIRRCNDAIPGEEISDKISRMETIVQRIFERAEAHPEIVSDLKKLMDYYLPMTIKLLNAYAEMDRQPIQGETILASKKEIEGTLDTLNSAFEKLLDSVFRETAMDVSSDISVLQTLLAQEGLTDDGLTGMRKEKY